MLGRLLLGPGCDLRDADFVASRFAFDNDEIWVDTAGDLAAVAALAARGSGLALEARRPPQGRVELTDSGRSGEHESVGKARMRLAGQPFEQGERVLVTERPYDRAVPWRRLRAGCLQREPRARRCGRVLGRASTLGATRFGLAAI